MRRCSTCLGRIWPWQQRRARNALFQVRYVHLVCLLAERIYALGHPEENE